MKQDFQPGSFDFAYIDADKVNQANYVELCLHFVKHNGFIILDNMFYSGTIIKQDEIERSQDVAVLAELGVTLPLDSRVDTVTIMLADGVTILRKK